MTFPSENPYQTLGVPAGATETQLKAAHRRLARRFHPDRNPRAGDRFVAIQAAYDFLMVPRNRAAYDTLTRHAAMSEAAVATNTRPRRWKKRSFRRVPPTVAPQPAAKAPSRAMSRLRFIFSASRLRWLLASFTTHLLCGLLLLPALAMLAWWSSHAPLHTSALLRLVPIACVLLMLLTLAYLVRTVAAFVSGLVDGRVTFWGGDLQRH